MRRLAWMIAVFLIFPVWVEGQVLLPTEPLQLVTDYCRFRGADDKTTNVEIYYSFLQRSLTYKLDTAGYSGALDLTLLQRTQDSVAFADRWLIPHIIRDTAGLQKGMSLVGLTTLTMGDGAHTVTLIARDRNNPKRVDSVSMRIPIALVPTDKMAISDVEFATTIRQGTRGGPFYKNTLDVVPNVSGIYGEGQRCFYYAEIYNLLGNGDNGDYYVRTSVYNSVGKEIISREKPKKRSVESVVCMDNFAVDRLHTGTYTLSLILMDSTKKPLCVTGKKFFVYNTALGVDSTLLAAGAMGGIGLYSSMEEPELDREFRWARWEATDQDKEAYEKLKGVEAKRQFMYEFWKKRGPEKRKEYLSRIAYVNGTYGGGVREGYNTDRGRVYVMYGPPDDYERHPYESDMRPYEIWTYNSIQGGVIFVFVQRLPAGDYELVHSTHRNELHDENWDRPGITR